MQKKILVSGGAGFLGSHLCDQLVDTGNIVYCLDNFSSGTKGNIDHLLKKDQFRLLNRDVRNPYPLPPVDSIYHLASRASPKDFTNYPVEIALSNTVGTKKLLEHAIACDAKMLFASTSEVYGDPEVHPQPETYTGNVNLRGSRSCYDESKRFGETLVEAYIRDHGMDARTVRIFNTYGPRMRPDDGRVVPTFISQALSNENITVFGDGTQTRCFCYVDDLVKGLLTVMKADDISEKVYNIGNDNEKSILELAKIITDLIDTESEIEHEPLPEDDPKQRKPDLTRIKNDLCWESEISLRTGLEKTIGYYQTSTKYEI